MIKTGDIIGSNIKPLQAYYQRLRVNGLPKPKRLPRKLKKTIKKSKSGVQMRVVDVRKSHGAHTFILKPI